MYSYYAMAAAGYRLKWKMLITIMQMMHFITICLHGLHIAVFLIPGGCDFPMLIAVGEIFVGASFFALFAHFFVIAYVMPKKQKRSQSREVKSRVALQQVRV